MPGSGAVLMIGAVASPQDHQHATASNDDRVVVRSRD